MPLPLSDLHWAVTQYKLRQSPPASRRLRFMARSLLAWTESRAWYRQVRRLEITRWAASPAEWLEQVHRPFFDHRLSRREVARLLVEGAAIEDAALGREIFRHLLSGTEWVLARFEGRAQSYALTLRKEPRFSKEGTLCLCLRDESGLVIKRLVFSFAGCQAGPMLLVGCVQTTDQDPVGTVRRATRDLHAMQPRLLLIEALRCLADLTGCTRIRAVSESNHVYESPRYRRRGKMLPSYDALWELVGGVRSQDGNFEIPMKVERRTAEEYASHKRAEYRRRLALLDTICAQVHAHLKRGE